MLTYYKYLFTFTALLFLFTHCGNAESQNKYGTPKIKFYHTDFDFGTIKMGEKPVHDFMFKNTGDGDLFVKNVKADCGCTVAKYNKEAIKAGEESMIEIEFSSEGFPGFQTKEVTVFTNAGDSIILRIAAVVDFELSK